jgi:hypothetical protein
MLAESFFGFYQGHPPESEKIYTFVNPSFSELRKSTH